MLLKFTYGLVPIVAGLDKFTNLLTHWEKYLSPALIPMLPFSAHTFMMIVGVIEIIAGVGVLLKPKIFGYVVGLWLLGIIVNLLMIPGYYDVALRDLGLALGAFALARLSAVYDK